MNLHLLGYRSDVAELYKTADIYVLPSLREGLNVSIMEAMAAGLPIICSNIRGNCDLVSELGGVLCDANSVKDFSNAINALASNPSRNAEMGLHNKLISKQYSVDKISTEIEKIYTSTVEK